MRTYFGFRRLNDLDIVVHHSGISLTTSGIGSVARALENSQKGPSEHDNRRTLAGVAGGLTKPSTRSLKPLMEIHRAGARVRSAALPYSSRSLNPLSYTL